jgi:hypothetical protein
MDVKAIFKWKARNLGMLFVISGIGLFLLWMRTYVTNDHIAINIVSGSSQRIESRRGRLVYYVQHDSGWLDISQPRISWISEPRRTDESMLHSVFVRLERTMADRVMSVPYWLLVLFCLIGAKACFWLPRIRKSETENGKTEQVLGTDSKNPSRRR